MAPRSPDEHGSGNRFLDGLSPNLREILGGHLEPVTLQTGQTVHEPGATTEHVLFPTRGMISMVATMRNGASVEIGMIGKDGMFSASAILGDDQPSQHAMVQLAGEALRMSSHVLRREAAASAALQGLLLRYVQATLVAVAQTAACNRLHLLEQRCARWLLSAHDRAEADEFAMTHEFLAMMLGVRRPGVTLVAQSLQSGGLITYNHGTMTIVDRAGLEAAACECYRAIQDEFSRLLGPQR